MTTELMQKKKGLPSDGKAWQGYLALCVALGVCVFFFLCVKAKIEFAQPRQFSVLYPLVLLIQTPALSALLGIGSITLFMGLTAFAIIRRVIKPSLLIFVLGWGVLGCTIFSTSTLFVPDFEIVQTLSRADHIYHLLSVWDPTPKDSTIRSYSVVECDSANLICHFYAAPYRMETTGSGSPAFDQSGQLFIGRDGLLRLHVEGVVYALKERSR